MPEDINAPVPAELTTAIPPSSEPATAENGEETYPLLETTNFVVWMINTQQERKDPIGYVARMFAKDPVFRSAYLTSDLDAITAYMRAHNASANFLIEQMKLGYVEWQMTYDWYALTE